MSVEISGSYLGFDYVLRMPTIAETEACRKGEEPKASKTLFHACITSPSKEEVTAACRKKGGLARSLGYALYRETGILATEPKAPSPLEVLEEHEYTDAIAEVVLKFEHLGDLHVLRYARHGLDLTIVMREPTEDEHDRIIKGGVTVSKARDNIRSWTVFPTSPSDKKLDCTEIDERAPGLYIALQNYACAKAGFSNEVRLGEA